MTDDRLYFRQLLSGRDWAVGVRPEDMHRVEARDAHFAPRVELVEPVGSEAFITLRQGAQMLVAKLPPHDLPQPGDALPLRLDAARLHFFDIDTGKVARS